jgi:hypothetical protein
MASITSTPANILAASQPGVSNNVRLAQDTVNAQQAAKTMEMQKSVGQLAQQPTDVVPTTGQLKETAAKQATENIAAGTAGMQQAAQGAATAQQADYNQKKLQRAKELANKRISLQQTAREQEQQFAGLAGAKKAELFDDNMQFKKDELNRTQFNDRQLVDWALTQAKNETEMAEFENMIEQSLDRKRQVVEHAARMLEQQLQEAFAASEQGLDQQAKEDLFAIKQAADEARRKAEARANSTAAAWSSGGAIVGGIIGGVVGAIAANAPGAIAGAGVGSGVGSAVGGYIGAQTSPGAAQK